MLLLQYLHKMNTVFFNYPYNTDKIAFTITDKPVAELKEQGIIEEQAVTLVRPYSEDMSLDELAKHNHPDKLKFNHPTEPTDVIFNIERVQMFYYNVLKEIRDDILNSLDKIQLRALLQKREDIVDEIEADKQKLRDLAKYVDYSKADSVFAASHVRPYILIVNYEDKYTYKLARGN